MIILDKDCDSGSMRFILIPNRSINWSIIVKFYILTCMVSFSIALLFGFMGYWYILPFSGMEMLLLGGGLYMACRKIYRQEVITADNEVIKIEKGCHGVDESWKFDRHWVRIALEKQGSLRTSLTILIGSHGNFVEVGSFLTDGEKESLAIELNGSIISGEFLGRV